MIAIERGGRSMVLERGVLGLIALAAMTSATLADCRIIGGRFSMSQNMSVTSTGVSTKGAGCGMRFASPTAGHFSSIAVTARPSHGALREFGAMSFIYKLVAGFKGVDRYSLRICGTDPGGSGCATVTYEITVQ
jgi:hypothetical protein